MSRKIILIKQELLLLVYELNRSGLLAENEKIRPIAINLRFCQKLTRWMRRSGLICLARSSRTGLDMSHILFMVEILLLTFYYNVAATIDIYTFTLHDALPNSHG